MNRDPSFIAATTKTFVARNPAPDPMETSRALEKLLVDAIRNYGDEVYPATGRFNLSTNRAWAAARWLVCMGVRPPA